MNPSAFYQHLKDQNQLEDFCRMANTSAGNFQQIVFYNGSISRRLAQRLSANSAKFTPDNNPIQASEFMFPE